MKPMLKKDFFLAIENLLKAGFQPRFYTVNSGRIGLITFTDKNGTKQVEQVYSCTSLAANTGVFRVRSDGSGLLILFHSCNKKLTEILSLIQF
ncbi:hypothetical protein [Escherichia coli]|uniref:hypothetical protein n=1 Tax=Escherichia coli TaxID=562 RepID=UPI00201F42D8|nr:hypothetical protein [Escherichia coli]